MRLLVTLLIAVLGYCTLTVLQIDRFADDPGVGWHLETGRLILRHQAVPHLDPFLGTPTPRPWVADQWLSDVVLAALDRSGGWPLTYAVLTLLTIATFFGIVFQTAHARTHAPLAASVATFIALKLASIHFIWRPVIFAFCLFAAVVFLTQRLADRMRSGAPLRWRDVLLIPPVFALWANLHPSFALGLIVCGLIFMGTLYDVIFVAQRPLSNRDVLYGLAIFGLAALATLLTPYGAALHLQVWELVGSDFFMRLNTEWRPLVATSGEGQLFYAVLGLIVAGGFITPRRTELLRCSDLFAIGVLAAATIQSVRYLPFFAIVAAPLVAAVLVDLLRHPVLTRLPVWRRPLERYSCWYTARPWNGRTYAGALTLLCAFPVATAITTGTVYPFTGPFGPSAERYPYGAVDYLVAAVGRNDISGPVRLAASPDWGGFITWHGRGAVVPIIDDRNSLLGIEPYELFLRGNSIGGDTAGYLRTVGATYLALATGGPLDIYLRDTGHGTQIYRDSVAVIYTVRGDNGYTNVTQAP